MKRRILFVTLAMFFVAALVPVIVGASSALANGGYAVDWWTVANGGGASQSAGGQYVMQGSIGQPLTGFSTGGTYTVSSGFWQGIGAAIQEFLLHLPILVR